MNHRAFVAWNTFLTMNFRLYSSCDLHSRWGEIIVGEISFNQPVRKQILAKRFGVSRNSIRDALLQLSQEGVLVYMPNCGVHVGFVTKRLSDQIEIRDIAGKVTRLKPTDIASEALLPISMIPAGLANGMSIEDLASLVHFLAAQKQ
jgi:DNA-binding GntR family transcriptional regulator